MQHPRRAPLACMLLIYLTYTANTNISQMFFIGWPTKSKKKQSTIILDLSELAVVAAGAKGGHT